MSYKAASQHGFDLRFLTISGSTVSETLNFQNEVFKVLILGRNGGPSLNTGAQLTKSQVLPSAFKIR